MKERLSNGQFAAKHPKRGGRKKGTPNKTTRKVKEFLAELVDNPEIQEAVKVRIMNGDAVAFFRALEHVVGKPKETAEYQQSGGITFSWKDSVLDRLEEGRNRVAEAKVGDGKS